MTVINRNRIKARNRSIAARSLSASLGILFFVSAPFCFCLFPLKAQSAPIVNLGVPFHVIMKDYLRTHREYVNNVCGGDTLAQFDKIYKEFLEKGIIIPRLESQEVDFDAIKNALPELKDKRDWLEKLIGDMSASTSNVNLVATTGPGLGGVRIPSKEFDLTPDIKALRVRIKSLLGLKKKYFFSSKDKKGLVELSREQQGQLKKEYQGLLAKIPFLLNYKFPVDHLHLRELFENAKNKEGVSSRKQQNNIYLIRKILEDGSQDPDHSKNDSHLRAILSTLKIRLEQEHDFLPDDVRYDFNSMFVMLERALEKGKEAQIRRLQEWKERVDKIIIVYETLNSSGGDKNRTGKKEEESSEQLVSAATVSKMNLRNFSLGKQKDAFQFWSTRSETMQALFALETILYNEVGNLDGREALERKDIVQVVINRKEKGLFTKILPKDSLYPLLLSMGEEQLWKHPWLNILLKEGEFSFTYYFMPSSLRIYCPDMSRLGAFLRRENLKIALKLLANPNRKFMATRYFSRHSMLGRIDMGSLWSDYIPEKERVGALSKHSRALKKAFLKTKYDYFYSFPGPKNNLYHVLGFELNNSPHTFVLSMEKDKLHFFNYRNPNYFKYFFQRAP